MSKIDTGKCKRNHLILAYKECPFCCAIDGITPTETDSDFLKIYNDIKEMDYDEIVRYYHNYLPTEPDVDIPKLSSLFE